MYKIMFTRAAQRTVESLPAQARFAIRVKIATLAENPRPDDCVKLSGSAARYRIRHGSYRVIYDIADMTLIVIAIRVGDRREVYRRL